MKQLILVLGLALLTACASAPVDKYAEGKKTLVNDVKTIGLAEPLIGIKVYQEEKSKTC